MPSNNGLNVRAAAPQDELQEMLGHPPGWILNSGITIIAFVMAVGLLLSWLIRYPDELAATVVLEQARPPHELRPLISGRVDTLLYRDRAKVSIDDPIILLESAADWRDVDRLLEGLIDDSSQLPSFNAPLELGNIQSAWANYVQASKDWSNFQNRTIFKEKQQALEQEIKSLQKLANAYSAQKVTFVEEQSLVQSEMNRTDALHQEGVRSTAEWEQQKMQVLQYERQLNNMEVAMLQNEAQIQQLKTQLATLKDEYLQSQNALQLAIEQAKKQLIGSLQEWQAKHLLRSPIAGQLELLRPVQPHSTIQAGELLGTVVPTEHKRGQSIAHLLVPAWGIGKIKIGTPVKISLDAYPETEFGQLNAHVTAIDETPQRQEDGSWVYSVKAQLPDSLRTTYGKILPLTARMPGQAVLITEDRRILERVFARLVDLVKN